MKTSVLKDFFDGRCEAAALAEDLAGCVVRTSSDVSTQYIEEDEKEITSISTNQLLGLCDAFSSRQLDAEKVEQVAFALMASDVFEWDSETLDGSRVAEVVGMWDSPEINYPITDATMTKFRHYLLTGEDTFTQADQAEAIIH